MSIIVEGQVVRVLNYYHLKGGGIPETAVYIGRSQPHKGLKGSVFANPFRLSDHGNDRDLVIRKYRTFLWEQIQARRVTMDDLLALDGKDLVCFCAPKACHGDVVLQAVRWARMQHDQANPEVRRVVDVPPVKP